MKKFTVTLVLAVALLTVSCSGNVPVTPDARSSGVDLVVRQDILPDKPPFIVMIGKYDVRADPAYHDGVIDTGSDPLDYLGLVGFEIWSYENIPIGQYSLLHMGFRFDVIDGQFSLRYTAESNGTCYDIAYAFELEGSFVSPSEARGRYVRYRNCQPTYPVHFIATRHQDPVDAAPVDSMIPDTQIIHPVPGRYSVRADPPTVGDAADPISPLAWIGLTVRVDDATGQVTIFFFAAMDTDGIIPVTDGKFDFVHGRGGNDGTVCPANGYAINGTFVSPTEFRGSFASIYFCQVQNSGNYIATLDLPPEPAADAGAPIDSSAP